MPRRKTVTALRAVSALTDHGAMHCYEDSLMKIHVCLAPPQHIDCETTPSVNACMWLIVCVIAQTLDANQIPAHAK